MQNIENNLFDNRFVFCRVKYVCFIAKSILNILMAK